MYRSRAGNEIIGDYGGREDCWKKVIMHNILFLRRRSREEEISVLIWRIIYSLDREHFGPRCIYHKFIWISDLLCDVLFLYKVSKVYFITVE